MSADRLGEVSMIDPFAVLGLPPNSSNETIRKRYLELVRTHSPERDPERFAAIRSAYEKLKDPETRLRHLIFEAGSEDSIEQFIADARSTTPRRRATVDELLALGRRTA